MDLVQWRTRWHWTSRWQKHIRSSFPLNLLKWRHKIFLTTNFSQFYFVSGQILHTTQPCFLCEILYKTIYLHAFSKVHLMNVFCPYLHLVIYIIMTVTYFLTLILFMDIYLSTSSQMLDRHWVTKMTDRVEQRSGIFRRQETVGVGCR